MSTETLTTEKFDYGELDAETRIVVQQRTSEIKTIARRAATDIIEIGAKLIEVKERLGHGSFGSWLLAEFAWEERTAQRFISVAEHFKSDNMSDLNFAPTALYLLSAPSVPDEAREEAIHYAEAGERLTVAKAKSIIEEYRPAPAEPAGEPAFATLDQLTAVVRSWIASMAPSPNVQHSILAQINLGNATGLDQLNRLAEYAKRVGARTLSGDLKRAVLVVHAELMAEKVSAAGTAVVSGSDGTDDWTPIATLEQSVRFWLAQTYAPVGEGSDADGAQRWRWLQVLEGIRDRNVEGRLAFAELRAGKFPPRQPFREGDLRQACNNVLDQLGRALGLKVGEENRTDRTDRTNGEELAQSGGEELQGEALAPEPEPELDEPAPLTAVVDRWFVWLAEEQEIPARRHGEPETEAVRLVLMNILKNRNNGGAAIWRKLRAYPEWPSKTTDEEKLNAARDALDALNRPRDADGVGGPTTVGFAYARPREITDPIVKLLTRKDQQIGRFAAIADRTLVYLQRLAARLPDPDDELTGIITELSLARAAIYEC